MFRYGMLSDFFADPRGTLLLLLLALPGRLLAISAHEAAHGWMAERCGDPTARRMGRVTLNPVRHLDPVGVVCMVLFGIGWARPVPVNPNHFKGNARKCDFWVSIAGIAMNLLMFLFGCAVMYGVIAIALASVPFKESLSAGGEFFRTQVDGAPVLVSGQYYYHVTELLRYGVSLGDLLIAPALGQVAGYAYEMLVYFVIANLVLAVFNLIPMPPLDGYHVLNDLILKGKLFATRKVQQVSTLILYLAMFSGVLTQVLGTIYEFVLSGIGGIATAIFRLLGLL